MKPNGMIISATRIKPGETYLLSVEQHLTAEQVDRFRNALKQAAPGTKLIVLPGTRLEVQPRSLLRQVLSRLGSKKIRS